MRLIIGIARTLAGMLVPGALIFALASGQASAAGLDFKTADFKVLDADGSKVIGQVHYDVNSQDDTAIVTSTAKYVDGESDTETDRVRLERDRKPPVMLSFDHVFYHPGHTLFMQAQADFVTGSVTCIWPKDNRLQVVKSKINFPPDTYAGAGMILPLEHAMRTNQSLPVLNDFVCLPGPKLIKVKADAQQDLQWPHFPGDLTRADISPDLGWLSYVAAPFIPEMHAWFDPADRYDFVGGKFTRYYKGPQIILARTKIVHTNQSDASNQH